MVLNECNAFAHFQVKLHSQYGVSNTLCIAKVTVKNIAQSAEIYCTH
jgi:hypothetical protein